MKPLSSLLTGLVFLLLACGCTFPPSPFGEAYAAGHNVSGECVVLLHGMGRTYKSMAEMETALEDTGYLVANIDYPSRDYPIEYLALNAVAEGVHQCSGEGAGTIHFVTHSMGGILVRYYLKHNSLKELGRVVMLSPPNQGSEVTDALADNFLYKLYFGEAGLQLGTGPDSFVMQLGAATYPTGIIIGTEHAFFDSWFSALIPGSDDGKVSVARAKLEGMADFLELPYSHPFIMDEEEVIQETIHFLLHGKFKRGGEKGNRRGQ